MGDQLERDERTHRTLLTPLIVAGVIIVLAAFISIPFLVMTIALMLSALFLNALNQRVSGVRIYAWTLPLAVLIVLSVLAMEFGLSPTISLVVVVGVSAFGLIWTLPRGGVNAFHETFRPMVLGILGVPLATLAAVERLGYPGASFSWLMVGDGLAEAQIMAQYRFLEPFSYIPVHYPLSTSGHLMLADALSFVGGSGGSHRMVADMQVLAVVTVLAAFVGVLQLHMLFGTSRRGWKDFVQGAVLGVIACSGAVIGLAAVNGFVSTMVTFALFTLTIATSVRFAHGGGFLPVIVAAVGIAALLSTWQPVAIAAGSLFLGSVWTRWRGTPLALSSCVSVVAVFLTWLGITQLGFQPGVPAFDGGGYYFPITPIPVFLLAAVAILIMPIEAKSRSSVRAIATVAIFGSGVFAVVIAKDEIFNVLASSFVLSSTRYYYVLKFIWLICLPVIPLVVILVMRQDVRAKIGATAASGAVVVLIAVAGTAANTPNFPWLPHVNAERNRAVADLVMNPQFGASSEVFLDYSTPIIDGTLTELGGWYRDFYDPDTSLDFTDVVNGNKPFFSHNTPWASRLKNLNVSSATDDELCAALENVPLPGSVRTSSPDTASRIFDQCGENQLEVILDQG